MRVLHQLHRLPQPTHYHNKLFISIIWGNITLGFCPNFRCISFNFEYNIAMIKMWSLLAKLSMKCSLEEDGQGSPGVVRAPTRSCCSCSSSCSVCSCRSAWVACSSCCRGACSVLRQLRRHGQQRGQTPSLTRSPLTSTHHALAVVSLQMEMVTYLNS